MFSLLRRSVPTALAILLAGRCALEECEFAIASCEFLLARRSDPNGFVL